VPSRQFGHTQAAVCRGFDVVAIDKAYLIELDRDIQPLWEQKDKNYHNRDLKPKLWDEIRKKLNIAVMY